MRRFRITVGTNVTRMGKMPCHGVSTDQFHRRAWVALKDIRTANC